MLLARCETGNLSVVADFTFFDILCQSVGVGASAAAAAAGVGAFAGVPTFDFPPLLFLSSLSGHHARRNANVLLGRQLVTRWEAETSLSLEIPCYAKRRDSACRRTVAAAPRCAACLLQSVQRFPSCPAPFDPLLVGRPRGRSLSGGGEKSYASKSSHVPPDSAD